MPFAFAEMSSANFEIRWDTLSSGGDDTSSSASYLLRDTAGDAGIGDSTSASYELAAGYRQGVNDQVITFEVFAQDNGTEQAATALVSTTITTSTAGLSIDDFILLVQDKGASQVSAVGRIVSIGAGTITLDELKDGGTAPTIDGTNDFVYALTSSTAALGTLDVAAVNTSVVAFDVTAEADAGYTVQMMDDGNLRNGGNDINDVADGTVTAGSEEYGGRSSDTTLAGSTFDTADTAVTTGFQDVADRSVASFSSRDFVTLKASMTGATENLAYANVTSFVISGNY
ncbi:hypothetical protein EPO34_03845 [Patescibacteria group bacterium]|nr:MAG: hypothetical protein EPO34_03845 [Patescibacteria group bacterium]